MPYTFGGSGGGKSVLQTISFINSTTWSPAQDMNAKIYVIGGGGSGGYANYNATGGGAGGCAVTIADLDASTTYTITIGAPGAALQGQSTGVNGNAGGASSFAGSGISTMTGNGGGGGQYDTTGNGTGTEVGGTGGSATGGTYGNFTGGAGGAISGTGAYYKATGGGAVGLWATGTAAPGVVGNTNNPDAGFYLSTSGYSMAAASGASVGGTYLNFLVDSADSTYSDIIRQPAGGLISLSSMGGGTHLETTNYGFSYDNDSSQGALPMGVGAPPIYIAGNTSMTHIQAGAFAGGGPLLSSSGSGNWGLAGVGGLGGGGGASLGMASSSDYWNVGGQGGGGCVLIEVLEYK